MLGLPRIKPQFVGVRSLQTDCLEGYSYFYRIPVWSFDKECAAILASVFPHGVGGLSNPGNLRLLLYAPRDPGVRSTPSSPEQCALFASTFPGSSRVSRETAGPNVSEVKLRLLPCQIEALLQFRIPTWGETEAGDKVKLAAFDNKADASPRPSINIREFDRDRYAMRFACLHTETIQSSDKQLFRWWNAAHDRLLRSWIADRDWAWTPDHEAIIALTPKDSLKTFQTEVTKLHSRVWYNVINMYAWARAKELNLRYSRIPGWRTCLVCQKIFHQSRAYTRWYNLDALEICEPCHKARLWLAPNDNSSKADIEQYLKRLTTLLKRVPPAHYEFLQSDFLRFTATEAVEALNLNVCRPSRAAMQRAYGTWFGALVDTGILEGGQRRGIFGTECIAIDGHACRSLAEKTIDDFLSSHNIAHEREVWYADKQFRADFKVGSYLVEYFGLSGVADYDSKTTRKLSHCKQHELRLIPIFPKDLATVQGLEKKLAPVLNLQRVVAPTLKRT